MSFGALIFSVTSVFWVIGLVGIVKAQSFGKKASSHLDASSQKYYLNNLVLGPNNPALLQVLGGQGLDAHEEAKRHVRTAHLRAAGFVGTVLVALAIGKIFGPFG